MSNGLSIISDLDLSKQSWSWLYLSQGFAHPSICPHPGEDDKYVLVPGVRWQPRRGFHCHSATSRRGGRNLFEEDFTLFSFQTQYSFQIQSILFKTLFFMMWLWYPLKINFKSFFKELTSRYFKHGWMCMNVECKTVYISLKENFIFLRA